MGNFCLVPGKICRAGRDRGNDCRRGNGGKEREPDDVAFDYDAFNKVTGPLNFELFSLLPGAAAASGLRAAAAASAAAQRNKTNNVEIDVFAREARLAEQRADNYQRLSSKLDSTVRAVTKARDTLVELKEFLSDLRNLVVLSQNGSIDDAERRQHADTFNQILGKLNIKVRSSGGVATNLIGSSIRDIFEPGEITYKTKPDSPVSQTVTGIYSGSDYTITDGDGNVFFADLFGSVLNQFPFDDSVDGETIGDDDTVSYDSDTGAISITHSGDPDPFIEGTLARKGLGVLHSYLYGNFTDPALLDEALADIDAASATLRFNIAVVEGQLTKVTAHRDFNAKLIEDHRALAIKAESEKSAEEQKTALEAERQQLLYAFAFQGTTSFDGSGSLLSLGIQSLFDFET